MKSGDAAMKVIEAGELEKLVWETFPERQLFSAQVDLDLRPTKPIVGFVHGGPDPFLDRQFDAWLAGESIFVPTYQLLNRLCRAGKLAPGNYAVRCPMH
jgi:hypothetical protein